VLADGFLAANVDGLAADVLLEVLPLTDELRGDFFAEDWASCWAGATAAGSEADCAATHDGSARALKAQKSTAHTHTRIEPDNTAFFLREDTLLPGPGRKVSGENLRP
jgi:hypothetical protein